MKGAFVEWTEDRRPMPESEIARMYPEAVFDMSLVTIGQGRVEAIDRSFFGHWLALVNYNGVMIEKKVSDLRILYPADGGAEPEPKPKTRNHIHSFDGAIMHGGAE